MMHYNKEIFVGITILCAYKLVEINTMNMNVIHVFQYF